MKALVIGPISAGVDLGYNKSIARALTRCGFETQITEFYASTPLGLLNRIRIDGAMLFRYRKYYDAYIASFNQHVLSCYRAIQPDLILVIRGSKLTAATLEAMASAVRVLWCHDAVRRCDITPDQLRCYDYRFVFEESDVAWLAEHYNLDAHFLPMGFDPEVYHPLARPVQDIDVFFVGKYYPSRRHTLERLAKDFPMHTLRFYGRHIRYREPDTWLRSLYYIGIGQGQIFVNHSLDPVDVNRMYARSKICLNMHHAQSNYGCNPRVFEIMGAGAFQLVDATPYILEKFGDLLITYDSYDSLRQTITAYLPDDHLRHEAAQKARQVALNEHTFFHRVCELLRACNISCAPAT